MPCDVPPNQPLAVFKSPDSVQADPFQSSVSPSTVEPALLPPAISPAVVEPSPACVLLDVLISVVSF